MISGHATQEGTEKYNDRFREKLHAHHFQNFLDLTFSSIGLGSYLGDANTETDAKYVAAVKQAVSSGINVLDTAINYRCQRSEKNYGVAIKQLIEEGLIKREELIICSKAGFLPFNQETPEDPIKYFKETYIDSGLVPEEHVSQGCHAMTPEYLETQLKQSLENLGVECIDIYYIHNPEIQLADIDSIKFRDRMRDVFEWMEAKVKEGKIKYYGTATWNGYRLQRSQADYLSLEELNLLAREVAGQGHHFKFVQLPFNLAMPEAWILPNQLFGKQEMSLLQIAERLGIGVIASASLLQAKLAGELPEFLNQYFKGLEKSSQKSLQFARSVKGILTALVGMKESKHIDENLKVAEVEKVSESDLILMFQNPSAT
jgi:aryl-alcohol dehydrogenase-like predicted oxidoreductase